MSQPKFNRIMQFFVGHDFLSVCLGELAVCPVWCWLCDAYEDNVETQDGYPLKWISILCYYDTVWSRSAMMQIDDLFYFPDVAAVQKFVYVVYLAVALYVSDLLAYSVVI